MKDERMISEIGSVRTLVDVALSKGIEDVVLSPGSRNAPFTLSFTALDQVHCQSVLDERSAGFVALGIAQQKRKPVVICCTSGSAVLNYTPAMVEAYYQRIPLVAITADRPSARIDQGEGQSMRQQSAMDNFVVKTVQLVEEHRAEDEWLNRRLVSEAFEWARLKGRPIHINVPLSEPLYGTKSWLPAQRPKLTIEQGSHSFAPELKLRLREAWKKAERIAILVTQSSEAEACLEPLKRLNEDPRVAIITETTSHIHHLGFVACIDRTIAGLTDDNEAKAYVPDLLITIGENIISKKLKAFFRSNKEDIKAHWHFGDDVMDTFEALTILLNGHPRPILDDFAELEVKSESRFGIRWRQRYFKMEALHDDYLREIEWSDFKAFQWIMDFVPEDSILQMGNSSVVRYIQLFSPLPRVTCYGNRGVSGIEGCTSTAIGAAQAAHKPVVFISGDQAFRYDSNALAVKEGIDRLRIIVINNSGGNIFRIIDGPEQHEVTDAFIEKHDPGSIEGLVRYHGVDYIKAEDEDNLEQGLFQLLDPDRTRCAVLEVFTPRIASPEILKAYFPFLAERFA